MVQLCRHILGAGKVCEQVAVRGTMFCRHHGLAKKAVARAKEQVAYGATKPLEFVYPEDRAAVQLNFFLVLEALNHKRIDHTTANTMNRLLQSCALNLGRRATGDALTEQTQEATAVEHVILTLEDEEIAPPREALEEGEAAPVHGDDCACQRCAEEYRDAAPEKHHAKCACGLCEADGNAPAGSLFLAEPAPVKAAKDAGDKEEEFKFYPGVAYEFLDKIRRRDHDAEYGERVRAAKAAGLDIPEYVPFDPSKVESEWTMRNREQEERNKAAEPEWWARRAPEETAGASA